MTGTDTVAVGRRLLRAWSLGALPPELAARDEPPSVEELEAAFREMLQAHPLQPRPPESDCRPA